MKKFFNNLCNLLFRPKKTKLFWLFFVTGVLAILLGIMFMPIWQNAGDWVFWKDWGQNLVNIIIFACIVLYLCLFLVKKIRRRSNGVVKVLTIVEFVLMSLIALGCILQQFKVINIGGACAILGLALWCRGVVEIFRAYYHQHGNNDRYPLWWLVCAIALVSVGVYLFAKPLFSDVTLIWIFVILLILAGIILFIDGFLAKPVSKKSKK